MIKRSSRSFTDKKLAPLCLHPLQNQYQATDQKKDKDQVLRIHPNLSSEVQQIIKLGKVATFRGQMHVKSDQKLERFESPRSLASEKSQRKTFQIRQCFYEPLKSKDLNLKEKEKVSKIYEQFYQPNEINCSFFKSSSLNHFNNNQPLSDICTTKSLVKKGKKRIQQCKTHKINWKQKNRTFDLAISAIKQDFIKQQTPPESLHELFVQIL